VQFNQLIVSQQGEFHDSSGKSSQDCFFADDHIPFILRNELLTDWKRRDESELITGQTQRADRSG
jgi:hypothetical protein